MSLRVVALALGAAGCNQILGITDVTYRDGGIPVDANPDIPDANPDIPDANPDIPDADPNAPDAMPGPTCFDGVDRPIVRPQPGELVISEWLPNPSSVPDNDGEWFELRADASFDLNGLQAGAGSLDEVVLDGANCIPVEAGQYVLVARSTDPSSNGQLPTVDTLFNFGLANLDGTLTIGVDGTVLHEVTWAATTLGYSIQVDSVGVQCDAPVGTSSYNGGVDIGTPRAVHDLDCQ